MHKYLPLSCPKLYYLIVENVKQTWQPSIEGISKHSACYEDCDETSLSINIYADYSRLHLSKGDILAVQ